MWRGSFVLTIKAAKTSFHSGRLMITYAPCDGTSFGVPGSAKLDLDKTNYCYREVIDLRDGSEWSFILPYASTSLWKTVYPINGTG
jgi:hypothetical protein